jgi:hypothetical protein
MNDHPTNGTSFLKRTIQRWDRVEKVLTRSPLGLRSQLDEITDVVKCDCVLLASSLCTAKHMETVRLQWKVHRVFPSQYAWLETANTHLEAMGLGDLADTLSGVASTAESSSSAHTGEDRMFLFNDWGCQSSKSREHCRKTVDLSKHPNFRLREKGKVPIRVATGKEDFLLTHVGLILLGSASIGKWELGESYLVFLDLEKADAPAPSPKQWFSTVQMECIPFMAYLAEVNAHFERLTHLNRLIPAVRQLRIQSMTAVERHAYCRSAARLTPLLDEDLPATIETLVQMSTVWADQERTSKEPAISAEAAAPPIGANTLQKYPFPSAAGGSDCQETKTGQIRIEEALSGFIQQSYPVLRDSCPVLSDGEKLRRGAHVNREVEWTRVWWNLEQLHRQSQHHRDESYRKWSKKLPRMLDKIKALLDGTPASAWFQRGLGANGELTLNGPCLAGFLVAQVVVHCRNRMDSAQLHLSEVSDSRALEVMTFVRRVVCAIRYALGCIRADEDVLRAQLWLLSEIGHERYGVDRRLDFERHLYLAAKEQPALYGLKPFYRDHLNHVIQVCLTGWLLLEAKYQPQKGRKCKISDTFLKPKQKYDNLLGQWFVASLLHDVGYVIDIGKGWKSLLEQFGDSVLHDLAKQTDTVIKEWNSAHADKWSKWGYKEDDRPGEDHGVVSALHVQSALAAIANPSAVDYGAALAAISHHNHHNAAIRFREEPLSVLLVLCDELQEWDRPWLDQDRAALALSTVVAFGSSNARQWHKPTSKVSANLRLSTASGDQTKAIIEVDGAVLDFSIQYSADIHRSHSLFNAWLGRSRSLQRIALGGPRECPLDFRYRMKSFVATPSDLTYRDTSEPELARLWRIVRDQRVWSVHRWMDAASNGKEAPPVGTGAAIQGVTYELVDNGKTEIVVIDVQHLGSTPLISDDLTEFWKAVDRWRHAGESMYLPE